MDFTTQRNLLDHGELYRFMISKVILSWGGGGYYKNKIDRSLNTTDFILFTEAKLSSESAQNSTVILFLVALILGEICNYLLSYL